MKKYFLVLFLLIFTFQHFPIVPAEAGNANLENQVLAQPYSDESLFAIRTSLLLSFAITNFLLLTTYLIKTKPSPKGWMYASDPHSKMICQSTECPFNLQEDKINEYKTLTVWPYYEKVTGPYTFSGYDYTLNVFDYVCKNMTTLENLYIRISQVFKYDFTSEQFKNLFQNSSELKVLGLFYSGPPNPGPYPTNPSYDLREKK